MSISNFLLRPHHSMMPVPHDQATPIEQPLPPQRVTIIESIATGVPNQTIHQTDAAQVVTNLPHLSNHRDRVGKIYENTRIETRHLAIDLRSPEAIDFSLNATLQARMQMYQDHAVPLATRVAKQALVEAAAKLPKHVQPPPPTIEEAIRMIVFVSSTGFVAPGVDTEVIKNLGLRRDIARVTVNFMGCAAAMNGLRIANDHVRAHPTHKVLVICLELSSINATFEDDMNDLIIHSIFGDGCAAVVVGSCEPDQAIGQMVIRDQLSYLIENTEDGIRLGVRDRGITCKLSRQLPDYIEAGLGPVIEQFLARHRLSKANVDLWAVHPGGTRIIQKAQQSLGLTNDQVTDSWEILRRYGNMLSSSVLFVLERMLRRSTAATFNPPIVNPEHRFPPPPLQPMPHASVAPTGLTGVAFSFSPGIGVEGMLFHIPTALGHSSN